MADSPVRSFNTLEGDERSPVAFELNGERFTCKTFVPGSMLLEHTARLTSADRHVQSVELLRLWEDLLEAGEYERFRKFIDDPAQRVSIGTLGEILEWAMEELSERPTRPSSPSARGRSATGATRKPASKR